MARSSTPTSGPGSISSIPERPSRLKYNFLVQARCRPGPDPAGVSRGDGVAARTRSGAARRRRRPPGDSGTMRPTRIRNSAEAARRSHGGIRGRRTAARSGERGVRVSGSAITTEARPLVLRSRPFSSTRASSAAADSDDRREPSRSTRRATPTSPGTPDSDRDDLPGNRRARTSHTTGSTPESRMDAFVAKVNPAGTALVYAGYIGGTGTDVARGIARRRGRQRLRHRATPFSAEATFPVTVGPDLTHNGGNRRLRRQGQSRTAPRSIYAGYIGGAATTMVYGIAVDACRQRLRRRVDPTRARRPSR